MRNTTLARVVVVEVGVDGGEDDGMGMVEVGAGGKTEEGEVTMVNALALPTRFGNIQHDLYWSLDSVTTCQSIKFTTGSANSFDSQLRRLKHAGKEGHRHEMNA